MKIKTSLAVLGAALALASAHADTLPAGTLVTGSVNGGVASKLFGWDHGYSDVAGSNIAALSQAEQEFITNDFSVIVDLSSDGTIQFWNNSGADALPGNYSFTFSFSGTPALTGITLGDMASITGGTIAASWVNASTVSITFSNLTFSDAFTSFSATAVSAVPEPASVALLLGGLGLIAARRARKDQA